VDRTNKNTPFKNRKEIRPMIQQTPFYSTSVVAGHLARSYSNVLRYDASEGVFQELHGTWVNIDDASFERYVRNTLNVLLHHAMNIGEEARNELHSMNNDASFYEIRNAAAALLGFTEPEPAPEPEQEAE